MITTQVSSQNRQPPPPATVTASRTTRLPARLRQALEVLSGFDMSDVRVCFESTLPAQLAARAVAYGTQIHLQTGAEDALAHEAWHVVQQKQGRVRGTQAIALAGSSGWELAVNDAAELEAEAEAMGEVLRQLSRADVPARGALRCAAIVAPVVQRAQMAVMVAQQAYTTYINPDLKPAPIYRGSLLKDMKSFSEDLRENTKLNIGAIPEFSTIIHDIMKENLDFASWDALAKEVEIRNIGYAVESTMRSMLEANVTKDAAYQDIKDALVEDLAEVQAEFGDDAADLKQKIDELTSKAEDFNEKIIRWTPPAYLISACAGNQVFDWLSNRSSAEPTRLNCWESILFAIIKTGPAKVTKEYFTWAIESVAEQVYIDFEQAASPLNTPRLYTSLIMGMDYYFPRHGRAVINPAKERFRPEDDSLLRLDIPADFVIPRGRILMFGNAEHFAISTGKLYPIQSPGLRVQWKRELGHGLIDLNGSGETLRERTVEDLIAAHARADLSVRTFQLVVAPIPICSATKTIELTWKTQPSEEEIDAYRRSLDAKAAEVRDKKIKDLIAARDRQLQRPGAKQDQITKSYATKISDETVKYENAVKKAWAKLNDIKKWIEVPLGAVVPDKNDTATFNYGPMDPYGGRVTF